METFWDIAVVVGLIFFCWSVSSSLDSIAKALRRLADEKSKDHAGI
jgi:hypothetical protein